MLDNKTREALKKIIFRFFDTKKNKVFIFGSWATNKAKKYSDIDIGIKSPHKISWSKLSLAEEALENSDLPYSVDLVDFHFVSDKFKKIAEEKIIPLN